jgi:hypothetical protein
MQIVDCYVLFGKLEFKGKFELLKRQFFKEAMCVLSMLRTMFAQFLS